MDCSVWNVDGKCLAIEGTNEDRIRAGVEKFLKTGEDEQVCDHEAFFLIRDNYEAVYVLAPVSYTHLDVYKRQFIRCASRTPSRFTRL